TASAMTSALSPASVRSMMMMPKTRAQNSGSIKNVMASLHQRLQQRDQHATDHHQHDGDGKTFDATDSHLVSPCSARCRPSRGWGPAGRGARLISSARHRGAPPIPMDEQ